MNTSRLFIVWLLMLVSGCASQSTHVTSRLPELSSWNNKHEVIESTCLEYTRWWDKFNDPQLLLLVDHALKDNLDLAAAEARISEARAYLMQNKAGARPRVDINSEANRVRTNGDALSPATMSNRYQIGFDASWEIDIFARRRYQVQAAQAGLDARIAEHAAVRISVVAELVRTYMSLRSLQARRILIDQQNDMMRTWLRLTTRLLASGLIAKTEFERLKIQANNLLADGILLDAEIDDLKYSLALLLGEPEFNLVKITESSSRELSYPEAIHIPIPAMVLRNRPDVYAAERALMEANFAVDVSKTELYPRINLLGNGGFVANSTGNLLERVNLFGALGPQLQWPIFTAGRVQADIDAADARAQAALHNFRQVVLRAIQETESALSNFHHSQARMATADASLQAARRDTALMRQRHEVGLVSLASLLEHRLEAAKFEDDLIQARIGVIISLIAVYKSTAVDLQSGKDINDICERPVNQALSGSRS